MRLCYLMVGIAGSGKSTKAKQIQEEIRISHPKYDEYGRADEVVYISSDEIRSELLGDVNDQSQNDKVFKEVHKRIKQAVKDYKHIIVDATNITIKSRKSILNCIDEKTDYRKVAEVMCSSIAQCKANNQKRDRHVPDFVIDIQAKKFEIPFYEEGFDEINLSGWDIGAFKVNSDYGVSVNITKLMDGFDQRNHHHLYDLGTHCRKVHEELKKRTNDPVLIRSGLIHDIGKMYVGTLKEDGSGEYSYKQHHNYGTYTLLQNLDLLGTNKVNEILDLLFYVNYHMQPFFIESGKSEEKWKNIFGEKKFNNLLIFNKCDKIGSGTHRE